jgi:cysteine dioxygenase
MFDQLKSLITALPDYNLSQQGEHLIDSIMQHLDEGIAAAEFADTHYCRQLIHRIRDFDVVLIGWMPSQKSPIHNHPSNGCLVYPIKGHLKEERFCEELHPTESAIITVGQYSYVDDGICVHRLGNASESETAISLHIYSPSNFVATIFEKEGEQTKSYQLQP